MCLVKVAKLVTALALALTLAAIIADSGLVKAIGKEYIIWAAMGLIVLIAGYLAFKLAKLMMVRKFFPAIPNSPFLIVNSAGACHSFLWQFRYYFGGQSFHGRASEFA